jgi:hypothetical protein
MKHGMGNHIAQADVVTATHGTSNVHEKHIQRTPCREHRVHEGRSGSIFPIQWQTADYNYRSTIQESNTSPGPLIALAGGVPREVEDPPNGFERFRENRDDGYVRN